MTGVALFDSSAVILASTLCSVHNDKNVSAAELLYGTSISGIGKVCCFLLGWQKTTERYRSQSPHSLLEMGFLSTSTTEAESTNSWKPWIPSKVILC